MLTIMYIDHIKIYLGNCDFVMHSKLKTNYIKRKKLVNLHLRHQYIGRIEPSSWSTTFGDYWSKGTVVSGQKPKPIPTLLHLSWFPNFKCVAKYTRTIGSKKYINKDEKCWTASKTTNKISRDHVSTVFINILYKHRYKSVAFLSIPPIYQILAGELAYLV